MLSIGRNSLEHIEVVVVVVAEAVTTFDECLEWGALLLPLLLQSGRTVSNRLTIVVVDVTFFECLEWCELLLAKGRDWGVMTLPRRERQNSPK